MTSLLATTDGRASELSAADGPSDPRHRRPLALLATLGGVVAAGSVLLVCLAIGVVGWFVSDAGTHGEPRDALQVGALGWLMAHGSGVSVDGVAVTAVPLFLTLLCAWATWRVGLRVGDSISGHGPDANGLADGERDWTVPMAIAFFTCGYGLVALCDPEPRGHAADRAIDGPDPAVGHRADRLRGRTGARGRIGKSGDLGGVRAGVRAGHGGCLRLHRPLPPPGGRRPARRGARGRPRHRRQRALAAPAGRR